MKLEFGKLVSATLSLIDCQYLKTDELWLKINVSF